MGHDRRVEDLAARQDGVVNRGQVLALGMTRRQIQWRIENGAWLTVDTGVYAMRSAKASWERQLRAAILSRPVALVAGRSAAHLLGFGGFPTSRPEILVPFPGNARSDLARIVRSRHYELIGHESANGFDATNPAETLLTLGYWLPPGTIERLVDEQMAAGKLTVEDFDPIFARLSNARVRGLRSLRRIVGTRDVDAYQPPTSELERLLYRVLDRHELPPYTRQVPVRFESVDATVDAYIDQWRMIVEGDGRRWHTRKADFERDRKRDNGAAAAGSTVIRFSYRMLKSDPSGCVRTLLAAGRWR